MSTAQDLILPATRAERAPSYQPPAGSKAIYDLREAFLLEVRADLSGDMFIERSRRPALLRKQA